MLVVSDCSTSNYDPLGSSLCYSTGEVSTALDNCLYIDGNKLIKQLNEIKSAGYTSVDIDGVIKMIYAAAKEQQINYC